MPTGLLPVGFDPKTNMYEHVMISKRTEAPSVLANLRAKHNPTTTNLRSSTESTCFEVTTTVTREIGTKGAPSCIPATDDQ